MRKRQFMEAPEIPIAPMIDCVFLMLVYFMATSSLERSEADLACPAGQAGLAADPLPSVDEQRLAMSPEGIVSWNGSNFSLLLSEADSLLLQQRLETFRATCQDSGSEPSLRLLPDDRAPHQAIVRLLDAITFSGIEKVHFP